MTVTQDWGFGVAQKLEEIVTYTIQVGSDVTVRVDDCGLPSKLDDPADDYDIAALVRVQVGRGDTRRRLRLHAGREDELLATDRGPLGGYRCPDSVLRSSWRVRIKSGACESRAAREAVEI